MSGDDIFKNSFLTKELARVICDDQIGYGMSRQVWSCAVLPDTVIKFESTGGQFQNVVEWETWQWVEGTLQEKWFAPCKYISPCGSVLLMQKTSPAAKHPSMMPSFLTDFKKSNYGMYKGKLVCHDYGTNATFKYGLNKRLRKITWSDK